MIGSSADIDCDETEESLDEAAQDKLLEILMKINNNIASIADSLAVLTLEE